MTTPPHRIRRALEQFHAARPWDHNAHYHRWILRQLPRRFGSALDVGSGSGDLARLLASRAATVRGIDADPAIVARARELTAPATPVTFVAGDALRELPPGPYDVITCVAAVHQGPGIATPRVHDRPDPAGDDDLRGHRARRAPVATRRAAAPAPVLALHAGLAPKVSDPPHGGPRLPGAAHRCQNR